MGSTPNPPPQPAPDKNKEKRKIPTIRKFRDGKKWEHPGGWKKGDLGKGII